jgi:hypothetical membrane protein
MSDHLRARRIHRAIAAGVLMPIVYYGSQLIAIPFAPHYSVVRQVASELGMAAVSRHPGIFNVSKILGTIPTWIAAFGFLFGLRRLGAPQLATWLTFLGMIAIALNDLQAGVFPLPDKRHEGWLLLGFPLWSFSFFVAASRLPGSGALRRYVAVSIGAAICLFAAQALFTSAIAPFVGLFQRIFAFTLVVPIGVSAWVLAARFRSAMLPEPAAR